MSLPLLSILTEIAKEKNVKFELVLKGFKEVILMAIRKKYIDVDDIRLDANHETGEIRIFILKKVVNFLVREGAEITLPDARKLKSDVAVGDIIEDELPFSELGRNAALTAKQALLNKVREVEKESIADEYAARIGELFTGTIQKVESNYVLISAGRAEFNLPTKEQIIGENYQMGKTIRFVLDHIHRGTYGSMLMASRASAQFLKALLEVEIPEIYEGVVKIKKVVREAGVKSKIAVYSENDRVDPVGACVGLKGMRIQTIMEQLNHERMDIILWSNDTTVMAMRALTPGKPKDVLIDRPNNRVRAIMPDDQISITLGKGKVNLKLASQLIGMAVDIIRESEFNKQKLAETHANIEIHELPGFESEIFKKLISSGIETADDLLDADKATLLAIPGLGEKTVENLLDTAKTMREKKRSKSHN